MNKSFTDHGWDDYVWWQQNDRKTLKKINGLIKEITRDPFHGLGKPEPLIGDLSGAWSRRINDRDRLVYFINGDTLVILACRTHYDK